MWSGSSWICFYWFLGAFQFWHKLQVWGGWERLDWRWLDVMIGLSERIIALSSAYIRRQRYKEKHRSIRYKNDEQEWYWNYALGTYLLGLYCRGGWNRQKRCRTTNIDRGRTWFKRHAIYPYRKPVRHRWNCCAHGLR